MKVRHPLSVSVDYLNFYIVCEKSHPTVRGCTFRAKKKVYLLPDRAPPVRNYGLAIAQEISRVVCCILGLRV